MYIPFEDYNLLILCRSIGLIGFSTYVAAFTALSLGWLTSARPLYFGLVLFASTCVLISLTVEFNLASALIQAFYIVISSFGILRRRKEPALETSQRDQAYDRDFALESEYSNERDWAVPPRSAPQPHRRSELPASQAAWPS